MDIPVTEVFPAERDLLMVEVVQARDKDHLTQPRLLTFPQCAQRDQEYVVVHQFSDFEISDRHKTKYCRKRL